MPHARAPRTRSTPWHFFALPRPQIDEQLSMLQEQLRAERSKRTHAVRRKGELAQTVVMLRAQ
eukprot:364116-Chlamydomonas_euryale.AAC.1